MRMLSVLALAGLIASATVGGSAVRAAPIPKHLMKAVENTDQEKLQGRWKLESMRLGKQNLPAGELVLEIKGDKLIVANAAGTSTATIKLDTVDGVKRMASSDTQRVDQRGAVAREADQAFGYILDGNKLTLAMRLNDPQQQNVVDPAKAGDDAVVVVLTRIVDKK